MIVCDIVQFKDRRHRWNNLGENSLTIIGIYAIYGSIIKWKYPLKFKVNHQDFLIGPIKAEDFTLIIAT